VDDRRAQDVQSNLAKRVESMKFQIGDIILPEEESREES